MRFAVSAVALLLVTAGLLASGDLLPVYRGLQDVSTTSEGLIEPGPCPLPSRLVPVVGALGVWAAQVESVNGTYVTANLLVRVTNQVFVSGDPNSTIAEEDVELFNQTFVDAVGTGSIVFLDNLGQGTLDVGDIIEVPGYPSTERLALRLSDGAGNVIGLTGGCA